MTIAPVVQGSAPIRLAPPLFLEGLRRRVGAGLLTGRAHPRSNYEVGPAGANGLHIRAADWWTALNVGLNELDVQIHQPGFVHYHVRYWRWAGYVLGVSGGLGMIGLALLLLTDVRAYILRNSGSMLPGLSVDQNLLVAWGMVLFWGFVWPWLLIGLHQRAVRRLVERIITEVDAAGGGVPAPAVDAPVIVRRQS